MTQYEQILEGITGGFFALNSDFRFTYWNRAAEEGTGLRREEVLGKHVFDVFPNAKDAELGEKYRTAMETRTFQAVETSYHDDRFEAWYDVRVYPAENGLSVFFLDITERKRAERQREALMGLSTAVNSSQHLDELCLVAAEKIAHFFAIPPKLVCIYQFDPRRKLLHLMAPSLIDIPKFADELAHKLVYDKDSSVAVRVALTQQPIVTDELVRGSLAPYFIQQIEEHRLKTLIAMPLRVQNELQGVLEVYSGRQDSYIQQDFGLLSVIANELSVGIVRKKLMEELTIKNVELESEKQKTEEAHDTLKRFLATFSHELRAPLNSIVGFSELLSKDIETLSDGQVQDFMKNVHVSSVHLQQLINDILDLSKIESGKMELHVEMYPISYFLDSVKRVLDASLRERKIDLQFEAEPDLEQLVVDQTRFRQILVNLVSNGIKYSNIEGRIIVTIMRVDNEIEVSVRDFGAGIKPENLGLLFRPFQQVGGTSRKIEGTGLGLAITKRLVELHGGRIWVESEWGKGSTFLLRIPMILPAELSASPEPLLESIRAETSTKEESPLVLIIEDNSQAAQLIEKYLKDAGYRTEVARDGVEGVEKAKRLKPAVITLDMVLPVKDGWQVMKELKRHPICKHIPIIIISITDEKKLGFSLGAVGYFVKPVNPKDLLETLHNLPLDSTKDNQHPKILVVDDDKTASDLIEVILDAEGYDVIKAYHGREGIQLASKEHPDLIILDLIMPEVSGFNVAYQLKQQETTRDIPIIILTSMDVEAETREQLQGFVDGLMSKSRFTKKDLLREIGAIERMR